MALLEVLLLGHRHQRLCIGILGGLPPTIHLLGEQAPLAAVDTEFSAVQAGGLQHHRELVGRAPTLMVPSEWRAQPPPAAARPSATCRG